MESTPRPTFAEALRAAIEGASSSQADLARELAIDPGQVSRWATGKSVPHARTVRRIEQLLKADLTAAFNSAVPSHELYVSAPIVGLEPGELGKHHDLIARVVESTRSHVNSPYWPGAGITSRDQLYAPDLATDRNMKALAACDALLYLQFAPLTGPSSALIELGIALGKRMKTTVIVSRDIKLPFMLEGFAGVAAASSFLPNARIYQVGSDQEAVDLIDRNGRHILGLT